ncbi:MAG: nitroreductase/quinone reductase family protein [Kiritimatiellia bacterium]|jgi:4-carboxymuconolactone decarboxylase|nr:nitroreductase/quinone reductase family protein [Pseudomonadales bacterium]MDP6473245.1 nitroreductase/quinone reductase family protein [Pseudomonadales bacterium]MDP6829170.1 nitroreductase/quinone reductase family protein [Pseudomonadales bacterium]MDP7024717.1 nitroreductase/quinone reductase family protein [Kiritimatiellia bacterium]|tara:strand:- start:2409 stop:3296 length:888 start_codon:yes stop_codon:yes gene_type:complete
MSETKIPKPDFMEDEAWQLLVGARDHELIRASSQDHVRRYQETGGGEDTFTTQGGPTLLLWTTGRKSGEERISPVNFMEDGDDVIVVGSEAGLPKHPHWALNLDKTPRGWVQVKDKKWAVTGRKITGEEREELWLRLTTHFRLWGHFQKYCDREFMVWILSPEQSQMPDERLARGIETALQLFPPGSLGSPGFKYPAEIEADWNALSMSTVLGDVWGRPGLEKKSRAMITIAAMVALDKPQQLRAYIIGGLNLGLERSEVCEVIMQMAVYAGFPAAIQGLGVAAEVFGELDAAAD